MAQQNVDINVNLTGAEATAKGLNYIGAAAESFGNKVASKMTAMFSAVAIGAMVFDKIGEAMSKNMATAKQIGSLSTKFHIDPKEVHSLMMAANDAGVQVRGLLMGMKQLGQFASKAIVDPDKADILKQMGFDMTKLNELASKPAAHLAEISQGLMNIGDENQRNKVGVMLLGRQYQQLLPMIEKLGTSAEARAEFLNNENAMTAEQVAMAKETAMMQSKMNEEWDNLIASLIPVGLFLTGFLSTIINMVGWVKKLAEGWKFFISGQKIAGQTDMQKREKTLRDSIANGTLSKEEIKELTKIKEKGGSIDDFVVSQLKAEAKEKETGGFVRGLARSAGAAVGSIAGPAGATVGAALADSLVTGKDAGSQEYISAAEKEAAAHKKRAQERAVARHEAENKKALENFELGETQRMQNRTAEEEQKRAELEGEMVDIGFGPHRKNSPEAVNRMMREFKGLDERGRTVEGGRQDRILKGMDERGAANKEFLNREYKGPTEEDFKATESKRGESEQDKLVTDTQKKQDKDYDTWVKELTIKANKYGKSIAAMAKSMGIEGFDSFNSKTGRFESAKKDGLEGAKDNNIDIKFTGEEKLAKKKRDKQDRALKRSERGKRVDGTPIEIAEDKLADAEDAREDAQSDFDTAKEIEDKAAAAYKLASEKRKQLMKDRDELSKKKGGLTDVEAAGFKAVIGEAATNESSTKAVLDKARDDRVAKQIASNTAGNAVGAAESALAKAKMETWAKERKEQEDLHKDKMDDIRSESEQRYKNMKLEGASEQEIAEARFDDQMKLYEDSVKEQEALQKEIDANRQQRVEEAIMAGDPNAYAKGDMTDAEKAALKGGREKVDAEKNKTVNALYAIDPNAAKSAGVVSDLGKLGGGGAVQFGGNNPVDEIRKSNRWLEIIAKGVTSDKFKDAGTFGALAKYAPVTGGATYGANTPSR